MSRMSFTQSPSENGENLTAQQAGAIYAHWTAALYDKEETQTEDFEMALTLLGEKPLRILEPCCGSGRILVPLAKAGHCAVGFDRDLEMLRRIPAKAPEQLDIHSYQADLFAHSWPEGFDAVVLAGNILINIEIADGFPGGYKAAQQELINRAAGALKTGGHLYLDFNHFEYPERFFDDPKERIIFEGTDDQGVTGHMSISNGHFDAAVRMAYNDRFAKLTLPDGRQLHGQAKSAKHIPTLAQVQGWLLDAGFVPLALYGDYDRRPVSDKTTRALFFAQKQ